MGWISSTFAGSARRVKARWHDADDAIQVGIKTHAVVQDMRVAPEGPLPKAIANERFRNETGRVILGIEGAARLRLDAEQRKIIWRDDKQADARRLR